MALDDWYHSFCRLHLMYVLPCFILGRMGVEINLRSAATELGNFMDDVIYEIYAHIIIFFSCLVTSS
jgi:hypothetical protein